MMDVNKHIHRSAHVLWMEKGADAQQGEAPTGFFGGFFN